jgi:hypothetical protein
MMDISTRADWRAVLMAGVSVVALSVGAAQAQETPPASEEAKSEERASPSRK